MNLNEVRIIIENCKKMLSDMIDAQEITNVQADIIYPIVLNNLLKNQYISKEYTQD